MTIGFALLFLFATGSFSNQSEGDAFTSGADFVTSSPTDSTLYTVFPFDTSQTWLFKKATPTDLTKEDIENIDKILRECIDVFNKYQVNNDSSSKQQSDSDLQFQDAQIDLAKYKRQYVPAINEFGQKEVWVNCLCSTFYGDWKYGIIRKRDGGKCYFNVRINLTTGNYYRLMINGSA